MTRYAYDALGRLTAVTDADSRVTRYESDPAGNSTAVVDALELSQDGRMRGGDAAPGRHPGRITVAGLAGDVPSTAEGDD